MILDKKVIINRSHDNSRQPVTTDYKLLVILITQARFTRRLEVVAVEFNGFIEELMLVESLGTGRIFSQRVRFQDQDVGSGHAEIGHGDPV